MKKNYFGYAYSELLSKYKKFSFRLQKNIANGSFWKLTVQKRQALLARIEKLRTRLESINPKLAGSMLATGFILTAGSAMSQANFVQQTGTSNPANAVVLNVSGYGAPIFADLDNDGDKDMIIGDYGDTIRYYKNTGTTTSPVFNVQTGTNSPFTTMSLNGQTYTVPTLGDIDADGDLDLLTGHNGDVLQFYRNTGTNTAAVFTFETGTTFPSINTLGAGYYDEVAPSFVDIDADGDLDVLLGNEDSYNLVMLRNDGTAAAPTFTFIVGTATSNPFVAINPTTGYRREPGFGDIDKDGDIDAWVAGSGPTPQYFQNIGTTTAGNYVAVTGTNNPFAAFVTNGYSYAAFVDIDGDGDNDYFVGNGNAIQYWKNMDPSSNVSVGENNMSEMVTVYPNPAQNSVSISMGNAKQYTPAVVLFDVRGAEVMNFKASSNDFTLDISALAPGIYTMKIVADNQIAIKKVVKN